MQPVLKYEVQQGSSRRWYQELTMQSPWLLAKYRSITFSFLVLDPAWLTTLSHPVLSTPVNALKSLYTQLYSILESI
uniref:Uncharacterized protein n=1 Tax=Octopus bimaculoides TaxID=37653 RepID=A0A0L8FSP6_OCTBM